MIASRTRLLSNIPPHNPKGRYSVSNVVTDGGFIYQNITGGNGTPSAEIDWKKQPEPTSSDSFNKVVEWDGTSTISVSSGFSGTVFNYTNGEFVTYTVAGTNLTITGINAGANDKLILTSN